MPSLLLFAWRKALTDSELPAATRHVALALSSYMDTDGTGARPAIDTLAHDVGRSAETVRRHVRHLEGAGWLLIEPSKGGRARTNRWRAHIPHHSEPSPNGRHPVDNPPEKPPHLRGGTKPNPLTSVEKPPRPRGGISYDLPTTRGERQLPSSPARDPQVHHPPQAGPRSPPPPPPRCHTHHHQEAA